MSIFAGLMFHNIQFRQLALKSPPLPKWDRWAKKLGCASDPPIPEDCRLVDRMRIQVFSPTYPTWALVGGDFKASRRNCIYPPVRNATTNINGFLSNKMKEL